MRIVVTADLHFGISPDCDDSTLRFIKALKKFAPIDLLVICGDVAETIDCSPENPGRNHERLFSEIEKLNIGRVAFCVGSHDIWTRNELVDSWTLYEGVLKRAANAAGYTYLDFENLYLDNWAVVGTMGHYDYSFATKGLEINGVIVKEGNYESKTPPGYLAPVWNDINYLRWDDSDQEVCERLCLAFEKRYEEAQEQADNIIVATHTAPILEMNGHQEKTDPRSNFLNAFSGAVKLGEIIMKGSQKKKVIAFSGHTHLVVPTVIKEGIRFENVGGDYGSPRAILLDE